MSQITEAACLIDQGLMFPHRQGFRDATGQTVLIGFKPGACSIYFDDEPIYHFDLEGRWQRAFLGADLTDPKTPENLAGVPGTHYLKAMDTTTTSLVRLREGQEIKIHRHRLDFAQTVEMDEHVRKMAMDLHSRIATRDLLPVNPPSEGRKAGKAVPVNEILDFLERIATWDTAAWSRQKQRFQSTFGPLPMAPPGAPGVLTLQATMGDSGPSGVGFGGSETTELYLRTPEEFQNHLHLVLSMWGRRMQQARGVYVSGSDLIHQPMLEVLNVLDQIQDTLNDPTIDIVGRVIDPPRTLQRSEVHLSTMHVSASLPSVEQLHEYTRRGLAHITIGIESTLPTVRHLYGRTWANEELRSWIAAISRAGIRLSLVWLVGSGGSQFAEDQKATMDLIESLALPEGTVIYFMDAAETATKSWRQMHGIAESNAPAVYELRDKLLSALKSRKVKVAHYTLEKEWQ